MDIKCEHINLESKNYLHHLEVLKNTPQKRPPEKKAHHCTFIGCNSSFARPYRLAQHLLVHNNIKAFACVEKGCSKAYTNKSHLDRHISKSHKKDIIIPTQDDGLVYVCSTCLKKYSNRQNLKRHLVTHHKFNFVCDICDAVFRKKHLLSAHMYIHTGVKAFSCELCEKTFVSLSEKRKHVRRHKIHHCSMPNCFKSFNYWSKLQKHLRADHGKEYICDTCHRHFKLRAHIIRHMKVHDPLRNFSCPYENCKRIYSRNSNLRHHILTKHENFLHECHICKAQLSTKAALNRHIMVRHEGQGKNRIFKTKADGRKVRKDVGFLKASSALKLAGLSINPISSKN